LKGEEWDAEGYDCEPFSTLETRGQLLGREREAHGKRRKKKRERETHLPPLLDFSLSFLSPSLPLSLPLSSCLSFASLFFTLL